MITLTLTHEECEEFESSLLMQQANVQRMVKRGKPAEREWAIPKLERVQRQLAMLKAAREAR